MKRIISIVLILVLALALVACGGDKTDGNDETKAATEPVADTTSGTETENDTAADTETEYSGIPDDKIYADIWEQTAINEAIARAGEDYKCVGTEKGTTPDGLEAWIISLQKIDDDTAPVCKCCVSGKFCYFEEGAEPETEYAGIPEDKIYAGIWEQSAINEAITRIGDDYKCVGTEKGKDPDGLEAWIISLQKTDDETAPVYKCYVGDKFCYLEEGAPDPLINN